MVPNVRVEVRGREAVVVHPVGEIDYSSLEPLREALLDARIAGVREIVVDLGQVTFLDSQGLAVILYAHQRQRSAGGHLILRNLNEDAYRLLNVTNLSSVIDVDHGTDHSGNGAPRTSTTPDSLRDDTVRNDTVSRIEGARRSGMASRQGA
jgi:stage II sporulation protein AA (anti-sigma F factor antagonist)